MGNLEEQITIRMSFPQRQFWEAAAAQDQRKLADWIRIRLDRCAAAELPNGLPPEESPATPAVKRKARRKRANG